MAQRNKMLERVLKAIQLFEINPQGFTVAELTHKYREYGYLEDSRTVRRDIAAVETFFPLALTDVEGSREKRYRLDSVAKVSRNVSFSVEELIALYLSRESMSSFKSSPLFQHIISFFEKLEKTLGAKAITHLAELKEKIIFTPMASWQSSIAQEVFDTVYRACEEGHVVEVSYNSNSGRKNANPGPRRLGPEGIYFGNGGAYLIAKDLGDNIVKFFAFSRMNEAVWTDDEYISENVDVSSLVDSGIGVLQIGDVHDIVIQVKEPMASYVSERRWHKTQTVIRNQDGIELKMNVKVNDELARWVLSLGEQAKVSEPALLRDRVGQISEEIFKAYKKAG